MRYDALIVCALFSVVQINNWIWSQEIISYANNACVALGRAYHQSTAYTLITCVIH